MYSRCGPRVEKHAFRALLKCLLPLAALDDFHHAPVDGCGRHRLLAPPIFRVVFDADDVRVVKRPERDASGQRILGAPFRLKYDLRSREVERGEVYSESGRWRRKVAAGHRLVNTHLYPHL